MTWQHFGKCDFYPPIYCSLYKWLLFNTGCLGDKSHSFWALSLTKGYNDYLVITACLRATTLNGTE